MLVIVDTEKYSEICRGNRLIGHTLLGYHIKQSPLHDFENKNVSFVTAFLQNLYQKFNCPANSSVLAFQKHFLLLSSPSAITNKQKTALTYILSKIIIIYTNVCMAIHMYVCMYVYVQNGVSFCKHLCHYFQQQRTHLNAK